MDAAPTFEVVDLREAAERLAVTPGKVVVETPASPANVAVTPPPQAISVTPAITPPDATEPEFVYQPPSGNWAVAAQFNNLIALFIWCGGAALLAVLAVRRFVQN